MSKYTIGSKVIKADGGGHGVVIDVMPPRRGRQLYRVKWVNVETDELEANLLPDCDISDPFERCMSGIFGSYSDYARKNTTFKILNSNNSTLSTLKASKTLFRAYQFKPLLKFFNSPNRRLLVADEVGLGKTIEAGHIMQEMKARGELQDVLIVCPMSLRYKWKEELRTKFGLDFTIYESKNKKRKSLAEDMQKHIAPIRAIVNYEMVRYKQNGKNNDIMLFLSKSDFKFSLVLCDEAHKMRKNDTQIYKGAEFIMSRSNAAVFLTATPVMISMADLYNLLHLLDNTRYYNKQIFENRIQENRPFVEALTDLNHLLPFAEIREKLINAEINVSFLSGKGSLFSRRMTVGQAFADDILYQEIIRMLNKEDSLKNRARLQYLISSMSMMNNIFSRTRKREVTTVLSQAERKPHLRKVALTENERKEFDKVTEVYWDDEYYTDDSDEEDVKPGHPFGLTQRKRHIASSVYAYLSKEIDLDIGDDKYAEYQDSKFEELVRIINEALKNGAKKLIVFATFRKTLKYLQIRLMKQGFGALTIHGMIDKRVDILDKFKNDPEIHILLSSKVGSEGLDMQFCNTMVNYDLPWNPTDVEQRIGRIDRFGQNSPTVNIYNIVVADSIQEEVYTHLLDRIGIFRGTIGDIEAIFDAPLDEGAQKTIKDAYNELERELSTCKLTKEERQRKYAEIELAIAKEKKNIDRFNEDLDNTLTSDAYFLEEIERIQNSNAYVTENDLRNYIETVIRQQLSTCSLVKVEEGVYELRQPTSNMRLFQSFLSQNQPPDDENVTEFELFKAVTEDKSAIHITFDQQLAYYDRKLYFINLYHPIIKACLYYFQKHDDSFKTSFCYALKNDDILQKGATYYMIVYKIYASHMISGVAKRMETLQPVLYSVNDRKILDDEALASRVFSRSQIEGYEHSASNEATDNKMIQEMRCDFAEKIEKLKNEKMAEIRLHIDSEIQRSKKQTEEYYSFLIENQTNSILEKEEEMAHADKERTRALRSGIGLSKYRIQVLEKEKEERLAQLSEASKVELSEEIISLNLINII